MLKQRTLAVVVAVQVSVQERKEQLMTQEPAGCMVAAVQACTLGSFRTHRSNRSSRRHRRPAPSGQKRAGRSMRHPSLLSFPMQLRPRLQYELRDRRYNWKVRPPSSRESQQQSDHPMKTRLR